MRIWERRLRLWSGLLVATFVTMHLLNHVVAVFGLNAAEAARQAVALVWHFPPMTVLLYVALISHVFLALAVLYRRRTLKMKAWEYGQLALGLLVVPLMAAHGAATRGAYELFDVSADYTRTLLGIFSSDYYTSRQVLLVLVVWAHVAMGIHFWLRFRPYYPRVQPFLLSLGVLIPAGALLGMFRAGQDVAELAADRALRAEILAGYGDIRSVIAFIDRAEMTATGVLVALVLLVLLARAIRLVLDRRHKTVSLTLGNGRVIATRPGRSILESLRHARVPHASVCGGRGRCTTCRIRVGPGGEHLGAPSSIEQVALERIGAPPNVRLACQARPDADLHLTALLPATTTARDARAPGGVSGRERVVTAMFLDLRGSTRLGEKKLPYDVLFILNQFFAEMAEALAATRGHYAQFAGDGLMALYGLSGDPRDGARDALRGARLMLERLDALNQRLAAELDEPLRIGIGVHTGEAIVGTMGPPSSPNHSAIGDNINIAARLEAKTKELMCASILSVATVEVAGGHDDGLARHRVDVRGRTGDMDVFAIASAEEIDRILAEPAVGGNSRAAKAAA